MFTFICVSLSVIAVLASAAALRSNLQQNHPSSKPLPMKDAPRWM